MKFSLALLAGASLVAAATIKEFFPACSVDCLNKAVGSATTCSTDDGVCICIFDNYVSIVDTATNCVIQACGSDAAVHDVLPAADTFCKAVSASASAATASQTATSSAATATNNAATITTPPASSSTPATTSSSHNAAVATGAPAGLVAILAVGAALL